MADDARIAVISASRALLMAIVGLVTALFALMSLSGSAGALVSYPMSAYAYDGHQHPAQTHNTISERGPPAAYAPAITYDAIGHSSHGVLGRPSDATFPAAHAYEDPASFAHVARSVPVTEGRDGRARPSSVVVEPRHVAAETAARACSFSGATTVLMADGTKKPIEDVKVGDKVLATDPETGEQTAKKVEHVFVHDDDLTDLQLADGSVLTTTEDHPYWSVDDQRFERADELAKGERVLGADGRTIEVSGLRLATTRNGLAYNLGIEGIHTYHVGQDAILVHNSCIPWSSAGLGRVAGDLERGASSVTVGSRSQAEELFLRMYQGKGYQNATGMSGKEAREFFGSKSGTYHWDEGDLTPGLPHNYSPHLQIHQPDGVIVRIFFGG